MVQKSISRGRPLEFDPNSALDEAMKLFWEQGFESTTIQDLEQRTGLARTSLYNTFGSKRELFSLALARYQRLLADQMLVSLEQGEDGLLDLHKFFDLVARELKRSTTTPGCLMVNSMTEFGGTDAEVVGQAEAYLARFRNGIASTLNRAAARGEIAKKGIDEKAALLVGLLLGINVIARASVKGTGVSSLVKSAHALLDDWQGAKFPKTR
jgi:TetR/AcrR family transcriptional repressor of nem operon